MGYQIKYYAEFDNKLDSSETYRLDIYKKDYNESQIQITLGADPVIQEWQDDDYKKTIKGCTLRCNIINDGAISLSDLYSNSNNEYQIVFSKIISSVKYTLFKGFLVYEDCAELMVDFAHNIQITATDGLALLKDISLDYAVSLNGNYDTLHINIGSYLENIDGVNYYYFLLWTNCVNISPNSQMIISGTTDLNGTYDIESYNCNVSDDEYHIPYIKVYVTQTLINDIEEHGASVQLKIYQELNEYSKISEIVAPCLLATGLSLETNLFTLLAPEGNENLFDKVYINIKTFINQNNYFNCYEVIEIVLSRFYMSLYQAEGKWNILRYQELYRFQESSGANFKGFRYDSTFSSFTNIITFLSDFQFEFGNIETGIIKSILRPVKYIKERFEYSQQTNTLPNLNLQELGAFIRQYTEGSLIIKEYMLPYWYDYDSGSHIQERFIKVVYDVSLNELTRYIVIKPPYYSDRSLSLQSENIEISIGDKINYSFSISSNLAYTGTYTWRFVVRITNGTDTKYLKNDKNWDSSYATYDFDVRGEDFATWQSFTLQSNESPINGSVNVFLYGIYNYLTGNQDTWYKDFSFAIDYTANGGKNVVGQTHTTIQKLNINNKEENDIKLDTVSSNSISGNLFLDGYSEETRIKANLFQYSETPYYPTVLGLKTTLEELFQRYISRYKLDCTVFNIRIDSPYGAVLSPNSVLTFNVGDISNSSRFLTGKLSINYANDSANLTAYQLSDLNESINDLDAISSYKFDYIYKNN